MNGGRHDTQASPPVKRRGVTRSQQRVIPGSMLRRIYDGTMALAGHRHALAMLGLIAFIEASIFPIPPDVLLIPMVLAARRRAWLIAAVCTCASVAGGALGYGIGYYLFEAVGRPLFEFYGYMDSFAQFRAQFNTWGAWVVAGAGLTPFPYKIITIASGVTALDPLVFMVASVLSRGARFFLWAGLLWYFGPPIRLFMENHLGKLTVIFFAILLGGFVLAGYIGQ